MNERFGLGGYLFFFVMALLAIYFAHAAIQGPFGLLERVQIKAETEAANAERNKLRLRVERLRNLTTRLSDHYLDLDLLDERARAVLGVIRPDEVIISEQVRPSGSKGL